jgi:hypothetical protein
MIKGCSLSPGDEIIEDKGEYLLVQFPENCRV